MTKNNIELKYCTKGNSNPRGKNKVYYSYHPNDLMYLEHIASLIFENYNCAIYYYDYKDGKPDTEELKVLLKEMQMFVVPVTANYLNTENIAFNTEFRFARDNHIPILPLLQDSFIAKDFNEKCDKLQYLNEFQKDKTAISFQEKLDKFLSTVLISDEMRKQIQDSFDARIFLSYRKKDRAHAQSLINMIHRNPEYRGIAIWYDEFLTTGEPWDEGIETALKKSDLYTLLVTPNLLSDGNFVLNEEYPKMRVTGKPIIPVETVKTNRSELEKKYLDIPECVDGHNQKKVSDALFVHLQKIAFQKNNSLRHTYYIGLAFLAGINVEINNEIALEMITEAASGGDLEAIRKLTEMYYSGNGVKADLTKTVEWQKKLVGKEEEILKENIENIENSRFLIKDRNNLAKNYCHLEMKKKAQELVNKNLSEFTELAEKYPQTYNGLLADCYYYAGYITANQLEDMDNGKLYYEKAIEIQEKENLRYSNNNWLKLADIYIELGILYTRMTEAYQRKGQLYPGELWELDASSTGIRAHNYIQKSLTLCEEIEKDNRNESIEVDERLASIYATNGYITRISISAKEAISDYLKSVSYYEKLERENSDKFKRKLQASYNDSALCCFEGGDINKAEELIFNAIRIGEELTGKNILFSEANLAFNYHNAGDIFEGQGKYQNAIDNFFKAIEIREKIFREKPVGIGGFLIHSYEGVVLCYSKMNNFSDAEKYLIKEIRCIEMLEKKDHKRYVSLLKDAYELARLVYQTFGHQKSAEKYEKKMLSVKRVIEKEKNNYEKKQEKLNKKKVMRELREEIIKMEEEENKRKTINEVLRKIKYRTKDSKEGESYFLDRIRMAEKMTDVNYNLFASDLANALIETGIFYYSLQDFESAENYLLKAVKIIEKLASADYKKYEKDLINAYKIMNEFYIDRENIKSEEYKNKYQHPQIYLDNK